MTLPASACVTTEPVITPMSAPARRQRDRLHAAHAMSPLRYPGSKRQMIPFFVDLLKAQPEPIGTFIEPFAGGASVSLHLAATGLVDRVVLGERDDLLYSFWKTAAHHTQWLIDAVQTVSVTLEQWDKYKSNPGREQKDKALAALFLNRTSFSGILFDKAGPIGGRAQSGEYPIDCRFPKATIIKRIRQVGDLARHGRLAAVRRGSYDRTIDWAHQEYGQDGSLVYLDPPFWAKADELYRHSFKHVDHLRLADYLRAAGFTWLLSYDAHPAVIDLYKATFIPLPPPARPPGQHPVHEDQPADVGGSPYSPQSTPRHHFIDFRYNAHSTARGTEELVLTNLQVAPDGYLRGTLRSS